MPSHGYIEHSDGDRRNERWASLSHLKAPQKGRRRNGLVSVPYNKVVPWICVLHIPSVGRRYFLPVLRRLQPCMFNAVMFFCWLRLLLLLSFCSTHTTHSVMQATVGRREEAMVLMLLFSARAATFVGFWIPPPQLTTLSLFLLPGWECLLFAYFSVRKREREREGEIYDVERRRSTNERQWRRLCCELGRAGPFSHCC